jgi:type II secretory pathway component PulM
MREAVRVIAGMGPSDGGCVPGQSRAPAFVWRNPSSDHHGTDMIRGITQALMWWRSPSELLTSDPAGSASRQVKEKKNISGVAPGRLANNAPAGVALEKRISEAMEWYGALFPHAGRMPAGIRGADGAGIPGRFAPVAKAGAPGAVAPTRGGAGTGARPVRSATWSPGVMAATNVNGAWLDLARAPSRIDTPMSALIAVLQRHAVSARQRERILTVLDGHVHITPELLGRLMRSEKRVDEASMLYASSKGLAISRGHSIQRRRDFAAALTRERLQQHLFLPDSQTAHEHNSGVYFDGNALVNAANRSVDDLAGDPSLMRLPDFARLSQPARHAMVVQWLDAHGQDTQYPFGSFEHSMASVLKTAALSRGEAAPRPYASHEALGSAFAALARQWPSRNSTLIDPKILFGLHLVKTHGIRLHGPASQRLEELKDCLSDLLTEAAGPPVFDRRAAALDMLAQETGLSKEELSRPRGQDQELNSLLDQFMHRAQRSMIVGFQNVHLPFSIHVRRPDGPASLVTLDPKALLQEAEARFREDLPHHPWFAAHARLQLRQQSVPLTADTVAEEISELVAQYQVSADHPSELRHWLDNMPIISNIIGLTEGVARGDVDEIISSVPVVSNVYNAVEGAVTGDGKRTATALITLVPYVGSAYIIEDGIASNDTAEAVGGVMGLGLDFVTEGEGHLLTRGRVAGHSALGEGRIASGTFSHHEMPLAVRMQAQHSLGALKDLGINDRALMLTDKAGEHGSVGDPYGLLAASDEAGPLSPQMQRLVGRLEPVPEQQRPMAMRRSEGGTWQDPETLAHYARIGAQLYRVAKDDAASTEGHAVWNPMDATGTARERTIRLENRDGRWQKANAPGLKGGARERDGLQELSADEVDNALAHLDDRPRAGPSVEIAPQGRGADPTWTGIVDWAHAEQARGLPLSDAEQRIHDSLSAPGRQPPAAALPGSSRARPHARLAPALPEHIDLLKDLPDELNPAYRPGVRRFLVHLEEQGQSWSQLVPEGSGPGARPVALEQAVNEGIRQHGLPAGTRAAINQAFGFRLQGDMNRVRLAPEFQEHKDLLKDVPEELDQVYRYSVNRFLMHLEEQGQSWSQLVPAGSGPGARPAALEQAVNEGIRHHGLQSKTRAAINQAFGFTLQGDSKMARLAPVLQKHQDLLKNLPEELSAVYRSNVNRFLVHLEEQGQSWSQLVPAGSGPGARPAALEQAVNDGIRHHGLEPGTRAALNQAFGFTLQSYRNTIFRLAPELQEHKDLLKNLPEGLSRIYRSNVNRFLLHLEEQGRTWSQLVPAGSGPGARPAALEQAVNDGILQHGLQTNARAALNQAFGFKLRGDTNIVRAVPDLPEHKDLLKELPEVLNKGYRSNLNRFLAHLEEQGQSWSQLVPAGSGPGARPAALEQAVNEGILHHALQPNTRAAINRAFGFKLQSKAEKRG